MRATWLTVLGLFAMLTAPSSAAAYALKTTNDGQPVRWARPAVSLRIDPALEAAYGASAVRSAARMAVDVWRGYPNVPDLIIAHGEPSPYDPKTRNNGIYLVTDWPFDPEQVAMTVTTFTLDGTIVGVDVLINGQRHFDLLEEGSKPGLGRAPHDLAAVLTHELGHALGLAHSDEDEATMYATIRGGETHQRQLSADDEEGVMAAYADMDLSPPSSAASCAVSTPRTHGPASLVALIGAALAVVRLRRRA